MFQGGTTGGATGIAFRQGSSANKDTYMDFYTNNTATAGAMKNAMTINNIGNVGIGTTTPMDRFFVHVTTDQNWGIMSYSGPQLEAVNDARSAYVLGKIDANPLLLNSTSSSSVGIGTTTPGTYKLYVNGTSYFNGNGTYNGTWLSSDQQFKTNIDSLHNTLTTIKQLKPKSFYFDTTNVYDLNFSNKKQYGFIAQEVETILPELVTSTTKHADIDTAGNIIHPAITYKILNYNAFFGILTKGIQEELQIIDSLKTKTTIHDSINQALQNQVNQLKTQNTTLQNQLIHLITNDSLMQNQLAQLSSLITDCCNNNGNGHDNNRTEQQSTNNNQDQSSTTLANAELKDGQLIVLKQNVPNPFNQQTTIQYIIPTTTQSASIMVFDLNGKLMKTIPINNYGSNSIIINGNELTPGMFVYSLIVNGKIIDTKRMILTQ